MNNWRKIFSWKFSSEIQEGNIVRLLPDANLEAIHAVSLGEIYHDIGNVVSIIKDRTYPFGRVYEGTKGSVGVKFALLYSYDTARYGQTFYFPLEHWNEFLEVVDE